MPRLTVAYDYICPWCWVAWRQAQRLKIEFPTIELEWKGYELLPEGMEYTPSKPDPNAPKKPRIPGRFELLLAVEELTVPKRTRSFSRSRLAMEGAEFATEAGRGDAYHDAVYNTYWEGDQDISDMAVLRTIAEKAGLDVTAFSAALEARTYRDRIVEFDEPAHQAGIWNVPTWEFPEEWVAEQPYRVIRDLARRFVSEG
jgi:predicted DsbA family dithiol-disulfide isomerase